MTSQCLNFGRISTVFPGMDRHIRILAILNIALGGLSAVGGLLVALLLSTVANGGATSAIAVGVGLFLICLGLPAVVAGLGLLAYRPWARILTLVLAFFHLFHFPFGTALGVYGFWVLLSDEGQRVYQSHARATSFIATR